MGLLEKYFSNGDKKKSPPDSFSFLPRSSNNVLPTLFGILDIYFSSLTSVLHLSLSVMLSSHVCLFLLLSPVDKYGIRRFISRCCLKIESYLQEKHNKLHIFSLRKPQAYVAFFTGLYNLLWIWSWFVYIFKLGADHLQLS